MFGICFSNFCSKAKPNKEEKKNKTRKNYIVLYFQIVLYMIVSILPQHHTSFVHQQRTEGAECMYPYLNKKGKGSPGNTKMVTLYLLLAPWKKSAI